MAGATIEEQQGLQRAIMKALEKEDRALGRIVGNQSTITTYVAMCQVGAKAVRITSTNLEAFIIEIKDLQASFPKMPIFISERIKHKRLS